MCDSQGCFALGIDPESPQAAREAPLTVAEELLVESLPPRLKSIIRKYLVLRLDDLEVDFKSDAHAVRRAVQALGSYVAEGGAADVEGKLESHLSDILEAVEG